MSCVVWDKMSCVVWDWMSYVLIPCSEYTITTCFCLLGFCYAWSFWWSEQPFPSCLIGIHNPRLLYVPRMLQPQATLESVCDLQGNSSSLVCHAFLNDAALISYCKNPHFPDRNLNPWCAVIVNHGLHNRNKNTRHDDDVSHRSFGHNPIVSMKNLARLWTPREIC